MENNEKNLNGELEEASESVLNNVREYTVPDGDYVLELIDQKNFSEVRVLTEAMAPQDIAELFWEIPKEYHTRLFRLLSKELECEVYPVHRLDTTTTGLMVFALNKTSAARLSDTVAKGELSKEYFASVHGKLQPQGELIDLLYHDRIRNKSFVVKSERKGAKRAQLLYETVSTASVDSKELSLVKIKLITGRTHQIRVQLANIRSPLYGDGKYGAKDNGRIHLHSASLSFTHPIKKERMSFSSVPEGELWDILRVCE